MRQNKLHLIVTIGAILCLASGWFDIFPNHITEFLYSKLFYIFIAISFFLQAPYLVRPVFKYPLILAATLCVIGAFLPKDSQFSYIKTVGLFGGVIISVFNRQRVA